MLEQIVLSCKMHKQIEFALNRTVRFARHETRRTWDLCITDRCSSMKKQTI